MTATRGRAIAEQVATGVLVGNVVPGLFEDRAEELARLAAATFAVDDAGATLCWGAGAMGQLGDGTTTNRLSPVVVPAMTNIVSGAGGELHTCTLNASSQLYCWGSNSRGQISESAPSSSNSPILIMSSVLDVTAGKIHTCAVPSSGQALCWGDNEDGQLGIGSSTAFTLTPTPLNSTMINTIKSISAGRAHTCLSTESSNMWCFGEVGFGQLGNGSVDTNQSSPVPVSSP